jgi:hypothetical protein
MCARSGQYALIVEKLSTGMAMVVAAGRFVAALAICTLSGVAWAVASVARGAAADGQPPEYYDAGNRFAFHVALMFLIVILPDRLAGRLWLGAVRGLVDLAVAWNSSTWGCRCRGARVRAVRVNDADPPIGAPAPGPA